MSNVSSLRDTDTGLPLLRKRPYDEVTFTADFSLRIGSDATVTTVNQASARALGRIDNAANLTVTNPIVRSGVLVVVTCTGGTSGETYAIDLRVSTSAGERLEGVYTVAVL